MDNNLKKNWLPLFISLISVSVFFVFFSAYTKYIFAKDYIFLVEAPCDPDSNICHVRDCDEYCPPNELENYSVYEIKASLFSECSNNSCANVCQEESKCEFLPCIADEETVCSDQVIFVEETLENK